VQGREVMQGSAGTERQEETFVGSPSWRKALKGEAHERWELKEASEGKSEAETDERVAKP